ncbi:hypothetical protein [Tropicibacter sp. Alg240-R139]|uniref:hypothetical protein n=1 Tax=Tropicibacter sp. Alg240-R139 TaxID=2305991 RepID=UPI0013E05404|nr:hypothetical protein [Tropicibacter sp. Alg240-R139]
MSKPDQSFERFYYTKVGLGEGCGCAEKIIDVHEFNRLAGKSRLHAPRIALPSRAGLRRFLQKAGLTSRPRPRD